MFTLLYSDAEWHPYKNVDGITTTLRNHLKAHHGPEYNKVVQALKLKHSSETSGLTITTPSKSCTPKFDLTVIAKEEDYAIDHTTEEQYKSSYLWVT
jgi:hypothetical protein